MLKTEIYSGLSLNSEIKGFVESCSNISVFQTGYFYNLYNRTKGLQGLLFVAREDGVISGLLLVQIQNFFGKTLSFLTRRAVITGGPIVLNDDTQTAEELLKVYTKFIGRKIVYTQVRRLFRDSRITESFTAGGFNYFDHLNYVIDLSAGEEACWKNLHQKRRNEVRKAVKEGVRFSEINYETETGLSYNILREIYSRAKLPLPEENYFSEALKLMGKEGIFRIFGGYLEDKLIGVMYVLCYKGVVYDWYAGSMNEYLKKCPNDLITWEVIRFGISNGYRFFDFGGAGNPAKEYGVRDYKKKFGGTEYNTGRFEYIHKPLSMKIAGAGFRLWQVLKGLK